MTQITIEDIKAEHQALNEKVKKAKSSKAVLKEVRVFIIRLQAAGTVIPPGNKRELLRSLADGWGNYVYRETGVYPSTELSSYEGPISGFLSLPPWLASLSRPVQVAILVGIVLLVIFFSSWISSTISTNRAEATQIAAANAKNTQVALEVAQTAQAQAEMDAPIGADSTPAASPTFTPTSTETSTPTPSPTPSLTATTQPTQTTTPVLPTEAPSLSARIINLQDGDSVSPGMTLKGVFENLLPGWSIHILVEPLSQVGTFYPLSEFWRVEKDVVGNEWSLEVDFQVSGDLSQEERLNISLVAAQDDEARQVLNAAVEKGLTELPSGVIPFPGITTVTREAFALIDEVRLVYASFLEETNNWEILTTRPDGSDVQRVPNPEKLVSLAPAISPSGEKIVCVGQEITKEAETLYLLWLMDSSGENRQVIVRQAGEIEQPAWSPDGKFIAYSAVLPSLTQSAERSANYLLFLYEVETGLQYQLTGGAPSDRFPSWMPDGKSLVFSARTAATGTSGIIEIEIDSGEMTVLVDMAALEETYPAVSPDGQWIAYAASPSPEKNSDIYVFDLSTTEIIQLTGLKSDDGHDVLPAWHPDGKSIYFQSFRTGGRRPTIWAVDLAGENLRQITSGYSDGSPFVGLLNAFWPIE